MNSAATYIVRMEQRVDLTGLMSHRRRSVLVLKDTMEKPVIIQFVTITAKMETAVFIRVFQSASVRKDGQAGPAILAKRGTVRKICVKTSTVQMKASASYTLALQNQPGAPVPLVITEPIVKSPYAKTFVCMAYVKSVKVNQFVSVMVVGGVVYAMKASAKMTTVFRSVMAPSSVRTMVYAQLHQAAVNTSVGASLVTTE